MSVWEVLPWLAGVLLVVWAVADFRGGHKRDGAFLLVLAALDLSGTYFEQRDAHRTAKELATEHDERVANDKRQEPRHLGSDEEEALIKAVRQSGDVGPFYFMVPQNCGSEVQAYAAQIERAFTSGGWNTGGSLGYDTIDPAAKGVFVCVPPKSLNDPNAPPPPPTALKILRALQAAHIDAQLVPLDHLHGDQVEVVVAGKP